MLQHIKPRLTGSDNLTAINPFGLFSISHCITGFGTVTFRWRDYKDSSKCKVISTATNTILTAITLPAGSGPIGIAITPDGSRAYVANNANNTVTVINTVTNTILTTIPLPAGSGSRGIAITPDGSRAYVANNNNDTVTLLDTVINAVVATLPADLSPFGIAITPILLF